MSTPITRQDQATLILIAMIWGVNTVGTKYALLHLPPLLASCIRFAVTALLLVAFVRPAAGTWRPLAVVGFATALHFGIQIIGLWLARDLSPMVIAMQLWIPASAIFASIFLGERMGARRIAGVAVAFSGIVLLAADGSVLSQWGAFALVGIASCIYGGVSVLVRRNPPIHTLTYQVWIALASLSVMAPLSTVTEHDQIGALHAGGWGPVLALVLGGIFSTIVANALMFELVKKYEVARTTPYMFLTPVIAIALSAVVFHDPITPQFLVGGVITMAGVALVALAERRLPATA